MGNQPALMLEVYFYLVTDFFFIAHILRRNKNSEQDWRFFTKTDIIILSLKRIVGKKKIDILWIKLATKSKPLYFSFFYAPGVHIHEDVRIRFYKILSNSYKKFAKKGDIYFLGDANARLGTFTNDLNIHVNPVTHKIKTLFMVFTEYCGLTLLNNVFG